MNASKFRCESSHNYAIFVLERLFLFLCVIIANTISVYRGHLVMWVKWLVHCIIPSRYVYKGMYWKSFPCDCRMTWLLLGAFHVKEEWRKHLWLLSLLNVHFLQIFLYNIHFYWIVFRMAKAAVVHVEYCGAWGYEPRYESLRQQILKRVPNATVTGQVGRRSKDLILFLSSTIY